MKLYIVAVLLVAAVACTSASPSKRSKNADLHRNIMMNLGRGDQLHKRDDCPLEGFPCPNGSPCPEGCYCHSDMEICTGFL